MDLGQQDGLTDRERFEFEGRHVYDGYFAIAGSIIRQAILDFKFLRFHPEQAGHISRAERRMLYHDAKEFLFTDRLEKFLENLGIQEIVQVDDIREEALSDTMGGLIKRGREVGW